VGCRYTDIEEIINASADEMCQPISSNPNAFVPWTDSQGDNARALAPLPDSQSVEIYLESFFQTINHVLFLFSESELRRNFHPHEYIPGQNLPTDICLVLALGAKFSNIMVDGRANEWYTKARLQLLSEKFEHDMRMMRMLVMICIFEIDDDVNVSFHFLGEKLQSKLRSSRLI
jgi:hypothetical protein